MTSIITSAEWMKLQDAAAKQFPGERLARGEVLRRYAMSGVEAKAANDAERKRLQQQHQATMCVAGPEGDKGGSPW